MTEPLSFDLFYVCRIRSLQDGFEAAATRCAGIDALWKSYQRWLVEAKEQVKENLGLNPRRLTKTEFKQMCDARLTLTQYDGLYNHTIVFLTEEEREAFDEPETT